MDIFYKGTSHWWFISKIDNFIWRLSWYMSDFWFFFLLIDINIWYCFLLFVVTVIAAAFHAQMFLYCSSSLWWMSKWYLSFVLSLNWDSALQMEIMKQCIPQNNIFEEMTMPQYWVYWLIFILIPSHHRWHGYIVNIAKLYPFFLLSYINSDVFSTLHDKHLSMEI